MRTFREYDEALLKRQHAIYHDETALIQSAKQAADELRSLFESDAAEPIEQAKAPATATSWRNGVPLSRAAELLSAHLSIAAPTTTAARSLAHPAR